MRYDIYTDGGARGNPGPAGIGVVIKQNGRVVDTLKKYIGTATNNQAEYNAIILAFERARELGARELRFHLDSELVACQLRLEYKVKDKELAKLFVKIWNMSPEFSKIEYIWIPREDNHEADRLVNEAIDGQV